MGVAPKGASLAQTEKPAISQGSPCAHDIDASPIRIERMLRAIFLNQEKIGACERIPADLAKRRLKLLVPGDERPRFVVAADELPKMRADRDNHLAEVERVIDYALTTDAYEDVRCTNCKPWTMPLAPLDFIRVAHEASPPAPGSEGLCKTCKGTRIVRQLKKDDAAKAAIKRISYFRKVLETTVLCAKVRAKGIEANAAFTQLVATYEALVKKFGSELQTAMEGADAAQGARMGILDAAMKFDPTRPEQANFGTVAYNWAYRNSRARKPSDGRAGIYALSLDSPVSEDDGRTRGDGLRVSEADPSLVIDMRDEISNLPEDQRLVMTAIFSGDTVASAAKALKLKRSEVRLLRDEAYSTLRVSLVGYVEAICD